MSVDPKQFYPAAWVDRARRINWYHTFGLDHGVEIEGQFDLRPYLPRYGIPESLRGKTALDVGASNGFFSFEFERRDAERVVAVDLPTFEEHDASPALRSYRDETLSDEELVRNDESDLHGGFYLLKEVFQSQVEHVGCNIYDLAPERVGGQFDLVFCGSLLIHLTDPLRALMRMRTVTKERCIIATVHDPAIGDKPDMRFIGVWNGAAWWKPSIACLMEMMRCAGFKDVRRHDDFELISRHGDHVDPTVVLHGTV